jgi:hypothetical protein
MTLYIVVEERYDGFSGVFQDVKLAKQWIEDNEDEYDTYRIIEKEIDTAIGG